LYQNHPHGQQQQQQQCFYINNDLVKIDGPVNVNASYSFNEDGSDLPMNDANTMRFFYNLGIEVKFKKLLFCSLIYFLNFKKNFKTYRSNPSNNNYQVHYDTNTSTGYSLPTNGSPLKCENVIQTIPPDTNDIVKPDTVHDENDVNKINKESQIVPQTSTTKQHYGSYNKSNKH
jgi:hypothetical protein